MNCYLHPELPAVAFCRSCGRSLCQTCQRPSGGTVYCQDHDPAAAYHPPPPPPPPGGEANPYFQADPANGGAYGQAPYSSPAAPLASAPGSPYHGSPGLSFALGIVPGVGAIYNGQYLKGLVHVLITGVLISLLDNSPGAGAPLLGLLLAAFFIYMPFEAYHTAKKRQMGLVVDEWSSILPANRRPGTRAPIGPIVLIAVGVLYLLNSLNLIDFRQIGRFWPVLLILAGAYMLYTRVSGPSATGTDASGSQNVPPSGPWAESRHE